MQILPVLDVMHHQVVQGIAGEREQYRAIQSQLCSSCEPLAVANAIRDRYGFEELYLADLDAIEGRGVNLELYELLQADGFRLWVDAGIAREADADPLLDLGIHSIVLGLETCASSRVVELLVDRCGDRLVFSLDLKNGMPLTHNDEWKHLSALEIAKAIAQLGAKRFIILDLKQVGTFQGPCALDLCESIHASFPGIQLATGGGIRSKDDILRARDSGVSTVLIATALHNGSLARSDLEAL